MILVYVTILVRAVVPLSAVFGAYNITIACFKMAVKRFSPFASLLTYLVVKAGVMLYICCSLISKLI